MPTNPFSLVPLTSRQVDLLLPWLDLYETAFPAHEKVLVSDHLRILEQKEQGGGQDHLLLAVLDEGGSFAGLVRCQLLPEVGAALLWYLAIEPRLRSTGLGAQVYRQLLRQVDDGVIKALVFEVEIPELQENENGRQNAQRRMEFYRRQGARLLGGVTYMQDVGSHVPPTPMHLMVHPLQPLAPEEAFALAKAIFGGALAQVAAVTLD